MTRQKAPKKSETIEVRVPYGAKTAFAERCRENGQTVSEAVRAFMEREIGGERRSGRGRTRLWHAVAALAAGLALGSIAAPSLAQSAPASRAAFERLDRNHDGVVSYDEFRR
ncbi:EF-hand domain-containing protein [Brevundimonas sp.]|jgi:hypothetical protein|uniref:EF-hand domain-containing protein n=1 Tax=Brevundimonas sp. TaxID=1871086 RepID=UPI0025C34C82|nr:EF-hand domain-containing protein [Brevundimonas sp.]